MTARHDSILFDKAEIKTDQNSKIIFGNGCVIHPKAKIIVEGDCSLYFGEYNIVEETATIVVRPRFNGLLNNEETITIYIGNYNHFKAGCYIENTTIENSNVFGYKCRLVDSYVNSGTFVNACVNVPKNTTIDKEMIVLDNVIKPNKYFNEEEFNNQIKLENTTLLAITYLLKENSNTGLFKKHLTNIIKDRIGDETKALATKTDDIFFRALRHNIYRKNDNLLFVCEAFVSFPKKKKNNGIYKELLSDCQKSDILLKAIKFDGLSLEEFTRSKTINNYFLEDYNPSYFSENLDVIKTLRWIYKNCNKVNKYGFISMIRGIYKRYFNDVVYANCFKVKLLKETFDYSPKFFISLFRLLYALDNVSTDENALRSTLKYETIETRVKLLGQKPQAQNEKLLYAKYLASIAIFLNKYTVVLEYINNLKDIVIPSDNNEKAIIDGTYFYSTYYYYRELAEIYNAKDDTETYKSEDDIEKANDFLLTALGAYDKRSNPSKRENRILTIFSEMIIYNKKHNNLDYVKDTFEKEALKMENTKFSYSIALKENFDKLLTKSKGE